MSTAREIPVAVRKAQLSASNPEKSVWVSANAGSGKTHVLAQRVLRLLLAGVAPAKILCLTFTKAAAANMAVKVFATLSKWTQIDDAALAASIEEIGIARPDAAMLTFARRLFARTVETPGGLKIHTIHAFCERLLHLFPFEANVPGSFEVVQDLEQAELLNAAKQSALGAAEKDRGALGAALLRLVSETTQESFGALLHEAVSHCEWFRQASPEGFAGALRRALGIAVGESVASIEMEMIEGGIAPGHWHDFADFFAQGLKTDCEKAALFRKAADIYENAKDSSPAPQGDGTRADCIATYLGIFFTKTGEPQKKLLTKNLAMGRPDFAAQLDTEQARLVALCERRKAAACFERTIALATIIREILSNYERAKAVRGLLDFDDLISRTLRLLQRSDARWVLFKLDSGIDHILVDEAQDTSEAQWDILKELTAEFAAGLGSNERRRTFFAVGDEKQSIFSFQGAAPHMFHEMLKRFERRFGSDAFQHIELKTSFRSVPAILDMVDAVFGCAEHQKGLVSADMWMGHDALKRDLPGLIEIWQPVATKEEEAPSDWRLPLDLLDESDPANKLAQRVAQKIGKLIAPGSGEYVFDSDLNRFRPVGAGDILILVRSRSAFFEAVIRALKQHKVPVAGADRLQLTEHIAVMDLMAAGRVALLPQDDLTLASVLKSPLIGLDDDDLLKLAPNRAASLFEALAQSDEKRHQQACETIMRWRARAALSPFQFYARLLSEDGGRRAMEARLGVEACDALDEFLQHALRAERDGIFSLARFLADLDGAHLEIKRDMEAAGDCVRVMTVHAAKGLEAKIVFLPDTCGVPSANHDPKVYQLKDPASGEALPIWSTRKDEDPDVVAKAREDARAEAENEHRRLLYVALTRAEERLYIAGFYKKREPAEVAWANIVRKSVNGFEEIPAFWDSADKILRRETQGTRMPDADVAEKISPPQAIIVPDFLLRPAPAETSPMPPLKPATALAAADALPLDETARLRREALERGRLMHVLLQYLPGVSPEGRRAAARAFLAARAPQLASEHEELIAQALNVLDSKGLAALFGPQSRAEVAVAGRITIPNGQTRDVSGQVDRIVETEDDIIVADFKTGMVHDAASVPPAFLTQMALYRATLAPLWPNKRMRMLLIFTAGPQVVELDPRAMDHALGALSL